MAKTEIVSVTVDRTMFWAPKVVDSSDGSVTVGVGVVGGTVETVGDCVLCVVGNIVDVVPLVTKKSSMNSRLSACH